MPIGLVGATLGAAGLGAASSLVGGGMNAHAQAEANRMNYQLTKEAWKRDDAKYQRGVKDMKAAGLNPIMASGMNPSNSNVGNPMQSTQPGEGAKNAGNLVAGLPADIFEILRGNTDISRTQAQADLIKAQTALTEANKAGVEHNVEWARDTNQPFGSAGSWSPASVLQLLDEIKNSLVDRGGEEAYGFLDNLRAKTGNSNGDKSLKELDAEALKQLSDSVVSGVYFDEKSGRLREVPKSAGVRLSQSSQRERLAARKRIQRELLRRAGPPRGRARLRQGGN